MLLQRKYDRREARLVLRRSRSLTQLAGRCGTGSSARTARPQSQRNAFGERPPAVACARRDRHQLLDLLVRRGPTVRARRQVGENRSLAARIVGRGRAAADEDLLYQLGRRPLSCSCWASGWRARGPRSPSNGLGVFCSDLARSMFSSRRLLSDRIRFRGLLQQVGEASAAAAAGGVAIQPARVVRPRGWVRAFQRSAATLRTASETLRRSHGGRRRPSAGCPRNPGAVRTPIALRR